MDTQELQILKNRFGVIGNDPQLNHAIEVAMACFFSVFMLFFNFY